jgi:two-component system phosphate regulon sensor histidine kinase PhoR
MNKLFFRLLVLLMSLSLIGIIQVYWFNSSFKTMTNNLNFNVKQVIGNVADKLQNKKHIVFYDKYNRIKDSTGKTPKEDLTEFYYVQRIQRQIKLLCILIVLFLKITIFHHHYLIRNSIMINLRISALRVTEVYNSKGVDKSDCSRICFLMLPLKNQVILMY